MKRFYLILLVVFTYAVSHSQEQIFHRNSVGEIITDSKYIDTFENGDFKNTTPYKIQMKETVVAGKIYTIQFLKYNGWENEPGDFHVIEVLDNTDQTIYTMKYDDGWDFINEENGLSDIKKSFYSEKLNENSVALFFNGVTINSQPPFLTILVIENGKCHMVFNKPMFINKTENTDDGLVLTVQKETTEWTEPEVQYNHPKEYCLYTQKGLLFLK